MSTIETVIVGVGQSLAGDDGVGIAVARRLRDEGLRVREATDASVVLDLLAEGARVVIVDAVVGGGAPGDVLRLRADSLAEGVRPLSSHGVGVVDALSLARTLYGDEAARRVALVGVVIERPGAFTEGLSRAVEDAIECAAKTARALAEEPHA